MLGGMKFQRCRLFLYILNDLIFDPMQMSGSFRFPNLVARTGSFECRRRHGRGRRGLVTMGGRRRLWRMFPVSSYELYSGLQQFIHFEMTQQIRRAGVVLVVVTHIVTIIFVIVIIFFIIITILFVIVVVVVVGSIQSAVTICMIRCGTARSTVHGQSNLLIYKTRLPFCSALSERNRSYNILVVYIVYIVYIVYSGV